MANFKEESDMQKISARGILSLTCLIFTILLAVPNLTTAMTIDGPNPVDANSEGSFYAAITIHATQGGNDISTVTLTGIENCTEIKETAHECLLHVPYGELYTEGFNMLLVDPEVPGIVRFTVVNCSGLTLEYDITILPPGYIDTVKGNWETIKANYR